MKIYETKEIKNIALLGSKGSGKTTLAESMLFECGVIKRRGTVEGGNTVSDYFPVEKEYGYSVFSTVFNAEFNGKKLNVIDCPGADDFVGNAYTALGVCDTGVILINAQNGVEVGTQNIFRVTGQLKKPIMFALNQIDGEKADYDNVIESMRETFGPKVIQIQYPLQSGPGFNSMVDVLLMKKYEWGPDGGTPTISEIPAEEMERAKELHNTLVEAAAENDETLMDKYFEQGHLTEDEMREGIRKGLIDRSIFPVFVVSAIKDMGVRRMMEFLGNVCPFVDDMPAPETTAGVEVKPDSNGPLSIFFFKTSVEPHIGEISYFKVMSGTLKTGVDLDNATRGGKERLHCMRPAEKSD
jgi:elongation factor G